MFPPNQNLRGKRKKTGWGTKGVLAAMEGGEKKTHRGDPPKGEGCVGVFPGEGKKRGFGDFRNQRTKNPFFKIFFLKSIPPFLKKLFLAQINPGGKKKKENF